MSNPLSIKNIPFLPGKLYTLSKAILFGTFISEERVKKRLEICVACPHVQAVKAQDPPSLDTTAKKLAADDGYLLRCGICGCRTTGGSSELLNLAAYEESPAYGCKADGGSKWKKAGV